MALQPFRPRRRRCRLSGRRLLFFAADARGHDRFAALLANRLGIALQALGLRAGLHLRTQRLPAHLHDLVVAGGKSWPTHKDRAEHVAAHCSSNSKKWFASIRHVASLAPTSLVPTSQP